MSIRNDLDYVTSDDECEYNKNKQTSSSIAMTSTTGTTSTYKTNEIQVDSDNELFVDDDSSIDLSRLDEKLKSYENESSKSNFFSDCNLSEIENNDENNNNLKNKNNNNNNQNQSDSIKKRFTLNNYLKQANKNKKAVSETEDDVILIDDESSNSNDKSKINKLKINKPDFSDESNLSRSSFFGRSSPIQISSENDSIIVKNSISEKHSVNNFLNIIENDLNKIKDLNDSSSQFVALSSSNLSVFNNNDSVLPDVTNKSSPSSNLKPDDKLNNSKAVVMVRKLSEQEIKKHTRLSSNSASNISVKITLLKNKESNIYNVKSANANNQTAAISSASTKRSSQIKKQIIEPEENKDTDNDFILARVKKSKKKTASKEDNKKSAQSLPTPPLTSQIRSQAEKSTKQDTKKTLNLKIPLIKKSETEIKKNSNSTESVASNQPAFTPLTTEPSPLNRIKFKIPKITSTTNKSPAKTANISNSSKSNLKKSSESIKKSIKILSSHEPKNRIKKQTPNELSVATVNKDEKKKHELQPLLELIITEKETKFVKEHIQTSQLISTQPNLNLTALNEKRLHYNKSNGWDYPLYSLSFLVDEHISQLANSGGSLDFNLLDSYIEKTDDPLCVSQLNKDERLELCKLMSRSAGRFNKYSLFGLDSSLRENLITSNIDYRKYGKHSDNLRNNIPLEFENEADEDQFLSNEIPKLTLSEAFVLYEHFTERLTSPWRKIKLFYDTNLRANSIQIEFSNNKLIENMDTSFEACVKFVCHRNKYDYLINTFLFNDVKQEIEPAFNLIDEAKKKINDNQVFDKMFLDNFVDKLKKNFDGPMEAPANIHNVNFHPDGYPIVDKSKYAFLDRCKRFNIDLPNTDVNNNRFDGFVTRLNSNRGTMKYALQHKPLSMNTFNKRLDQIKQDNNFDLDLNEIFDSNSNE